MATAVRRPRTQAASRGHDWLKASAAGCQIQTAKARFSEVFRRARAEGPQRITRQGREGVVMFSDEQYDRLVPQPGICPAG